MSRLLYDYKKTEVGLLIKLEAEGKLDETLAAVLRLIQHVYLKTPQMLRSVFKLAIQHGVTDDSPIWHEEAGITIDLAALKKQSHEE